MHRRDETSLVLQRSAARRSDRVTASQCEDRRTSASFQNKSPEVSHLGSLLTKTVKASSAVVLINVMKNDEMDLKGTSESETHVTIDLPPQRQSVFVCVCVLPRTKQVLTVWFLAGTRGSEVTSCVTLSLLLLLLSLFQAQPCFSWTCQLNIFCKLASVFGPRLAQLAQLASPSFIIK